MRVAGIPRTPGGSRVLPDCSRGTIIDGDRPLAASRAALSGVQRAGCSWIGDEAEGPRAIREEDGRPFSFTIIPSFPPPPDSVFINSATLEELPAGAEERRARRTAETRLIGTDEEK